MVGFFQIVFAFLKVDINLSILFLFLSKSSFNLLIHILFELLKIIKGLISLQLQLNCQLTLGLQFCSKPISFLNGLI